MAGHSPVPVCIDFSVESQSLREQCRDRIIHLAQVP